MFRRWSVQRQRWFPFLERAQRRDRRFKQTILLATGLMLVGLLGGTPRGRFAVATIAAQTKWAALRLIHLEPSRHEVEAYWRWRRQRGIDQTRAVYRSVYAEATPAMRALLQAAGMEPDTAILRWGNYDRTFLLSSKVFANDDHGRSYRLRPHVRAVWLQQYQLPKPNTGLMLIPATPDVLAVARRAGVMVLPGSEQTTNSWGCRGPEPDLSAPVRGIVLGDSYMQGLFLRDDQTPAACLQRSLTEELGQPAAILNTGVLGYSPEQYYYTLLEYAEWFQPQFVIVSLFANDFGDETRALQGEGDWAEAAYWLEKIHLYCLERQLVCLTTPVVCAQQLVGPRRDAFYPGRVTAFARFETSSYLNPIEEFLNAELRFEIQHPHHGDPAQSSPLYNGHMGDGHFSAQGAELWGRLVGRRVALLLQRQTARGVFPARATAPAAAQGGTSAGPRPATPALPAGTPAPGPPPNGPTPSGRPYTPRPAPSILKRVR
jgi:hypothetical protein